jgi:hypothetical protein
MAKRVCTTVLEAETISEELSLCLRQIRNRCREKEELNKQLLNLRVLVANRGLRLRQLLEKSSAKEQRAIRRLLSRKAIGASSRRDKLLWIDMGNRRRKRKRGRPRKERD